MLNTSQEILDFATGITDGMVLSGIELYESGRSFISYTELFYADPNVALELAWGTLVTFDFQAVLSSMLNSVVKDLSKLDNGSPYEKGEVLGNFVFGTLAYSLGRGFLSRIPRAYFIEKLSPKAQDLVGEIRGLLDDRGNIVFNRPLLYNLIQSRVEKNVSKISFSRSQLQRKIRHHGSDFGIKDPHIENNSKL